MYNLCGNNNIQERFQLLHKFTKRFRLLHKFFLNNAKSNDREIKGVSWIKCNIDIKMILFIFSCSLNWLKWWLFYIDTKLDITWFNCCQNRCLYLEIMLVKKRVIWYHIGTYLIILVLYWHKCGINSFDLLSHIFDYFSVILMPLISHSIWPIFDYFGVILT